MKRVEKKIKTKPVPIPSNDTLSWIVVINGDFFLYFVSDTYGYTFYTYTRVRRFLLLVSQWIQRPFVSGTHLGSSVQAQQCIRCVAKWVKSVARGLVSHSTIRHEITIEGPQFKGEGPLEWAPPLIILGTLRMLIRSNGRRE